jgi:4-deoxy-L-threo-5-hexosulose-uronate ketol-isomerase
MMKLDMRYGHHPEDVKHYDTETLRRHFLVEKVFVAGELRLVYSHDDRVVFGGAAPTTQALVLEGGKEFGTPNFLDRRELGVVNLGEPGRVILDGKVHVLANGDGLYVGRGAAAVSFESQNAARPARFYLVSSPAHRAYPATRITRANARKLGDPLHCNVYTVYQYVHPAVCQSCQLVMGTIVLEPGSVWNTYPPHTHERRMEVYFYFGMDADTRVFHMHGQPSETRHLVVANEQAVISPSWSIHSGVGSGPYSLVWGMAGENQTSEDKIMLGADHLK